MELCSKPGGMHGVVAGELSITINFNSLKVYGHAVNPEEGKKEKLDIAFCCLSLYYWLWGDKSSDFCILNRSRLSHLPQYTTYRVKQCSKAENGELRNIHTKQIKKSLTLFVFMVFICAQVNI